MKPFPPFAKTATVVANQVWIRAGAQGWRFMKAHSKSGEMVFPGDLAANEYTWPVEGLDVWIIGGDCPSPRLAGLVVACLLAGAESVHLIDRRNGLIRNRPFVDHYYRHEEQDARRAG